MHEDVRKFAENYEIKILNDSRYRAKYHPPKFFTDPSRADLIRNDIVEFEKEKVITLELPEGRLKSLIEMERRFFKWHRHTQGEVDMFQTLMDKEREEAFYRSSNDAVKKAYEQYSMLLNLAGYQRKI